MDKRNILIALSALVLLAAPLGCKRIDPAEMRRNLIAFAPAGYGTKSLIGSEDLNTNGSSLRVYDYVNGYEGMINGVSYGTSETFQYFQDEITYDSDYLTSYPWRYDSGKEYPWTKRGTHRFYGWLIVDKTSGASGLTASDLFGSPLTLSSNQTVRIPGANSLTFTTSSPQFDFSYSDIVSRNVTSQTFDPASPIDIRLSHLFSAISLTFQNASDIPIQINSVNIPNFPNSGSATIDYSGTEPVITYTDPVPGATPFFNSNALANTTVNIGEQYDILTGQQNGQSYFLTWPAPQNIISPLTITQIINEIPVYASSDSLIAVTYTVGSGNDAQTQTAKAKFPSEPLQAGKKHHINIQFTNKVINVTAQVLDWDLNILHLNFLNDAITTPAEGGKLAVNTQTCAMPNKYTARMLTGQDIECSVTIQTPVGARLIISMIGDTDYFTISPSSMTITSDELKFYVGASTNPTGGEDRTIHLRFSVILPDGREIDANSELIDDDIAFVRQ